ncbi:MAG: hypothetical protein R3B13_16265 [Polyangiaceae bacterium]
MSRALWVVIPFVTWSAAARAEEPPDRCFSAHEKGQELRNQGKLNAAQKEFAQCSVERCPLAVRKDCVRFATEISQVIPTVVLAAVDAHGRDVPNVRVAAAGVELAKGLDGRAIALDPGWYSFSFRHPDGRQTNVKAVIREGEKGRRIVARLPTPASSTTPAKPARQRAGVPTSAWVLAGIGVVGLASFGTFAVSGRQKQSDLERCAPGCAPDDIDAMQRDYLIADVSLAVGVLSLGGAGYLWLSHDSWVDESATASTTHESWELRFGTQF